MMLRGNLTRLALLVAVAAVLQYAENFIPLPLPVPGVKLGIANFVTLFAVYTLRLPQVLFVVCCRSLLAGLLLGSLFGPAQFMSVGGAVAAAVTMCFVQTHAKSVGVTVVGVSVCGALAHIVAQLGIAAVLIGNMNIILYLPVAGVLSIVTGLIIGLIFARYQRLFLVVPEIRKYN